VSDRELVDRTVRPVEDVASSQPLVGRQSGVGVTEVMIALVIFSTAILGIVGTAAHVGGIMNSSHVRLAAGSAARTQVEELLAMPYDSLANGTVDALGVHMGWTVAENGAGKEITLVYNYDLPSGARNDTLIAAMLKP
jgi:Tfp pilus assembly protein PilV